MKTAAAQLVTFFNTAKRALQFDLWTIALASGTVLRWTDADVDLKTADGTRFVRGPVISRDTVRWVRGIEVDQLKVKFAAPTLVVDGGQALPAFATAGGFDGAWCLLQRAYLDDAGAMQGALTWFSGQVADATPARMGVELVVKSQLAQLTQMLPRNLYQAPCLNDLYDSNCGVNKAAYQVTGTITAVASGANPILTTSLASTPGRQLDLGVFKFTSGANAGISRTVQLQMGGTGLLAILNGTSPALQFARPFPFPVQVGDAFTAWAGCDKLYTTCGNKFNNLPRFRATPFVPAPETIT